MIWVLRPIIYSLLVLLGYQLGSWLEGLGVLAPTPLGNLPLTRIYIAIAALLLGWLVVPRLGLENRWQWVKQRLKQLPPEVPVALTVGAVVGLVVTVLLTNLLSQIPGFSPIFSLMLALVLVSVFSALALVNREYLRPARTPPALFPPGGKLLDTSVLIDARIADVAELGFLEGPLLAPKFVLRELQQHADSSEPQRRGRGRRGLEVLERLRNVTNLEVVEETVNPDDPVDDQLLALAKKLGASLITNDNALQQLARIYGVKALSVQALSAALRSPHVAGETLRLQIVKEGREAGQGVGYLEDGTMVVVDDALSFRGKEVNIVITQSIQTQVGRLLFGKLADGS